METFDIYTSCPLTMNKNPSAPRPWLYGNTAGYHYLWLFGHPGNKVDATDMTFNTANYTISVNAT